jgi:hypothetical protein
MNRHLMARPTTTMAKHQPSNPQASTAPLARLPHWTSGLGQAAVAARGLVFDVVGGSSSVGFR